ncbi:hypothetical protein VNI00_017303 [Paramarasmius palmivorus]|uniref:Uncharacterized protein n=1 Tax=Paramarasmius palmivorus TaxID=297713 RepID=A0AAW0B6V8_9AGAR
MANSIAPGPELASTAAVCFPHTKDASIDSGFLVFPMAFDISYYVLGPILAIGILYGCYTVLFTQCVYIFFQRRQGQYWLQISLLAIIFLLSTISIATGMMAAAWDLQHIDPALKELAGTQNPITFGGAMQYGVEDSGRSSYLDPCALSIMFVNLSTVYAPDKGVDRKHVIASNYINCGLYLGTAFTNIFITSLIAGRIVRISRMASSYLGYKKKRLYNLVTIITYVIYPPSKTLNNRTPQG